MVIKYSKLFIVTGAITCEPVTIIVEYGETDGFQSVSIESLEGEYASTKEFEKASNRIIEKTEIGEEKIYNFLPLMLPDAHKLMDTLNEAIAASEEST